MEIDFNKLENMGYKVEINAEEKTVYFHPTTHDETARKLLLRVAIRLEFTNMETDELTLTVHRIQSLKALRIAAGW